MGEGLNNGNFQVFKINGFGKKLLYPGFYGSLVVFHIPIGREYTYGYLGVFLLDFFQKKQASDPRHIDIGKKTYTTFGGWDASKRSNAS